MKLFNRKKQEDSDIEETPEIQHQDSPKEKLESQLEEIKDNILERNQELLDTASKLKDVKKQYDESVSNLMAVKKESNEKKSNIESLERQYRVIKIKVENTQKQYTLEKTKIGEIEKTKLALQQIKTDIDLGTKNHNKVQTEISAAQTKLNEIITKRIDTEDQYQEILKKINDIDVTDKTKKPQAVSKKQKPENDVSKNVVEAASVVVASMKTKLSAAQKEVEVVKQLLEKERIAHQKTKEELDKIKDSK